MPTAPSSTPNRRDRPAGSLAPAQASRSRRTSRPTGEDRERAILATAERLLGERGFDGFSVDDLARGAGLSRPTFYFYFASKEMVVLSLLDRVIDEARRTTTVLDLPGDPVGTWRAIIGTIVDVFDRHRAVTITVVRALSGSSQIRTLWGAAMQSWVAQTAELIDAERARGAAPAGLESRELATALNLMNERVLAATFTDDQPRIAVDRVADVLLGIWLPAIYGTAEPGTGASGPAPR